MNRPFEHIRVLDFTQVLAGPYTSYQLACLGAEVIKIEHPQGGDQGRQLLHPTAQSKAAAQSALFSAVNSGKRSLSLDLKNPGAKPVLERLIGESDVLVENYKAGTMESLGLGHETVHALNPSLVYCSISGFGQTGPRSEAAAYDPVIQAGAGIMSVTGYEDTGPTKVGYWVCDMSTGLHAAFAIAAALFRRASTGEGEYVDVSMLDTAVSMMSPMLNLALNFDTAPPMTGNGTPGSGGASSVYPTRDGFVTIAAVTEAQFRTMADEIGQPDMADDPRFNSRDARIANADAYRARMVDLLAADTAANWQSRLAKRKVPAGQVQTVPEVVEDSQLAHRQMFKALPPPPGLSGSFKAVNLGFKLARDGPDITAPPPGPGEHTESILRELDFSAQEIAQLRADKVIGAS